MIKKSFRSLDALIEHKLIDKKNIPQLQNVVDNFPLAMTNQMHQLINKTDHHDPIAKQFIPSTKELHISSLETNDPIGDNLHTKIKGIVHRYPDRCLFTPAHICPVHCRFCFRKEKIGVGSATLSPNELEAAYAYIQDHPEIWEVIITGGDPFILKPSMLKKIIAKLDAIEHVEIIRLHTRVPVVEPTLVNVDLIKALKCTKTIYVLLHANHPNEFSPASLKACAALIDAGIPMLSQTILLKDINDNIEVLSNLMRCFVKNRIKPFYLHHPDLVKGTQHFRTSIAKGQKLMQQLRGRFSGLCQPTYVLDIPGGFGKVPVGPDYLKEISDKGHYEVEDYQGRIHAYSSDTDND